MGQTKRRNEGGGSGDREESVGGTAFVWTAFVWIMILVTTFVAHEDNHNDNGGTKAPLGKLHGELAKKQGGGVNAPL